MSRGWPASSARSVSPFETSDIGRTLSSVRDLRLERERDQNPAYAADVEWLADLMAAMNHEAGRTMVYDEAYLARQLAPHIEYNRAMIREAEEVRAVVI